MKKKLFSLQIDTGDYRSFVREICSLASGHLSSYVCVANVHMLIEARKSESFAQVVNGADIVTPDGMPLAKSLKWLYGINQDRVAGMDLLPDLLKEAEILSIPVYFYGGTEEYIMKANEYLKKRYPQLIIAGTYCPPFRTLTEEEMQSVIGRINQSGARLIFVALGCPKQERWMGYMKGRINGCMIGIGGALPVLIDIQKRAPLWMQHRSLEWLYRLGQEPKRLFKRYAITNTLYMWLMIKAILKTKVFGMRRFHLDKSGD